MFLTYAEEKRHNRIKDAVLTWRDHISAAGEYRYPSATEIMALTGGLVVRTEEVRTITKEVFVNGND